MSQTRPLFRSLSLLAVIIVLFSLGGCAAVPINVKETKLKKDESLELPIDARAEIVVPVGRGEEKIVVGNAYFRSVLDDGKAIKKTATEVFKKVFKEVDERGIIHDPHVIIKVKSDSSVNVHWGIYTATVDIFITYGDGKELASYSETGKAGSGFINDQNALENAYKKAFLAIAERITQDQETVALLKKGVSDSHIRVTDKTSQKLNSQYADLANAVVTVEIEEEEKTTQPYMVRVNKPDKSHGSGFFIDSTGHVLTNYHVIKDAKSVKVIIEKGKEVEATVVAEDEWVDLALLKVDVANSSYLSVKEPRKYVIGDEVIAIGSPIRKGLEHSISKGIISSIRLVDGQHLVQTDTAVNPGNSGGPLIHVENRELLGVVTMAYTRAEGLAFALPVNTLQNFIANKDQKKPKPRKKTDEDESGDQW